jgi:hypothetical protein
MGRTAWQGSSYIGMEWRNLTETLEEATSGLAGIDLELDLSALGDIL